MISRYTPKDMEALFSDESRFEAYLKVEIAATKAYNRLGFVPDEDLAKIEKNAYVDVDRIREIEAVTKHDVVAFTRQVSETLGEERRFIHYGLTSTDVVDTAMSLLYQKADDLILKHLEDLLSAVKEKALAYETTPCIGRTHGMHAEVTSFGLKFANYYDELKRGIEDFKNKRKFIEVCKLSGAVGNYADIDPRIQEYAAKFLHLDSIAIATQVISRDRHEHYASSLAIIATTFEKIAVEIRNLSRTEIHEVEEGFSKGQKGSSAMPQKRNPISSENVTGCVRMMRGYLIPILEDNTLYHERDISHSSVERVALIDLIELFDYTTLRLTTIIQNLMVYPEKMLENIHLTHDGIFAANVLKVLIQKGFSREASYDLVQPYAMNAALGKANFQDAIRNDKTIQETLTAEEINRCFSFDHNLKYIDWIYRRVGLK